MVKDNIKRYYRLLSPGNTSPVYLLVYVTHRCDSKCGHCFFWRDLNTQQKQEMTVEEYEILSSKIGPLMQVTLTGGSPELRNDLPDIAAVFNRNCKPLNITICMNGRHTDTIVKHVESILTQRPKQQLTIGISLDGLGEQHDAIRQTPGLFDKVIKTFEELNKIKNKTKQLKLAAAIVVSGLNYDTAFETAAWARKNLPIDILKPILIRGNPKDSSAHSQKAFSEYSRIVENDDYYLKNNGFANSSFHSLAVATKEQIQRKLITDISETGQSPVKCAAMRENAVIHADANVLGCELKEEIIGNLRDYDMDLRKIWNSFKAKEFRNRILSEKCSCYHHCFLAPAIFRTPKLFPDLITTAWKLKKNNN